MMENTTKKPPVKVFQCGPIKAAVWLNAMIRDGEVVEVPSVKINRSYKDKDSGEWKNTGRLYIEDLPKVAMVATEAYRYFRVYTREPEVQEQENNDKPENNLNDNLAVD